VVEDLGHVGERRLIRGVQANLPNRPGGPAVQPANLTVGDVEEIRSPLQLDRRETVVCGQAEGRPHVLMMEVDVVPFGRLRGQRKQVALADNAGSGQAKPIVSGPQLFRPVGRDGDALFVHLVVDEELGLQARPRRVQLDPGQPTGVVARQRPRGPDEQGHVDQEEYDNEGDGSAVLAGPSSESFAGRDGPGLDRLVGQPAVEVVGQLGGAAVAAGRVFLQALQADRLQVPVERRDQLARRCRLPVEDLQDDLEGRAPSNGGRPVSNS
jgi:hypothetical protein